MKKYTIGITASLNKSQNLLNTAYIRAFSTKYTTPVIIPIVFENENEITSKEELEKMQDHIMQIVKSCDALVLSGGADLSPTLQGEKITDSQNFSQNRDMFEKELVKWFLVDNKPIMGICRGFQLLGNFMKLNYFQQDISITKEEHNGLQLDINNRKEPIHSVHIFGKFKKYIEDKKYNLGKDGKMKTNSWHHQGFTLMPNGERVLNKDIEDFIEESKEFKELTNKAGVKTQTKDRINNFGKIDIIMATNSVIEGFQHKEFPIVAFQYHPEEYKNSPAIEYFIEELVIKPEEEKAPIL